MPPTGGLIPCGDRFPSDFLCPLGTDCIPLASDYSSVSCCPQGESCRSIRPISCDVHQWNATLFPNSEVHSNGPVSLGKCGQECCPVGYDCQDSQCVTQSSKEELAQTTRKPTLPTATKTLQGPGATTSATSTGTNVAHIAHPSYTNQPNEPKSGTTGGLNTTTQALISVLAAILAVLVVASVTWYLYRRQNKLKRSAAETRVSQLVSPPSKAELDGIAKALTMQAPTEMNAIREPRELPALHLALQKELGVVRYPRAAQLEARRPRTLNSVTQELEADAEKAEWI